MHGLDGVRAARKGSPGICASRKPGRGKAPEAVHVILGILRHGLGSRPLHQARCVGRRSMQNDAEQPHYCPCLSSPWRALHTNVLQHHQARCLGGLQLAAIGNWTIGPISRHEDWYL